jgi:hypothetical protein
VGVCGGRGKKRHGWQTFGKGAGLELYFCPMVSLTYPVCSSVLIGEAGVVPQAFVTERLTQILTRLEPVLAGPCYSFLFQGSD